ncbi:MAG TPA: His/Gly/Thr/Pro-type tRNA ligase C-terminal domain-containing protein, partial [Pirellulaceae bacterium]|nr:His/Gly/Thr/Pro-type tRNA ligase C-terminal domain-containing protein [Pirellulaceae bacterium]
LPGIGASLGLDRLLAAMEELGMLAKVRTPAEIFIPFFDKDSRNAYLALAGHLRAAGLGVEVYPDAKKLGQQLQYADKRGFRLALIAGSDELSQGVVQLKDLATQEKSTHSLADNASAVVAAIRQILASSPPTP